MYVALVNRVVAIILWIVYTAFMILFNKKDNDMNIYYGYTCVMLGVILWNSNLLL